MKKAGFYILLMLTTWFMTSPVMAKKNKYDRGIVMKTFIPKGQWMVGATFSYNEHVDQNFEFLSVLKDINSEGYSFKVTPFTTTFTTGFTGRPPA